MFRLRFRFRFKYRLRFCLRFLNLESSITIGRIPANRDFDSLVTIQYIIIMRLKHAIFPL